jgi:hypothetical protein
VNLDWFIAQEESGGIVAWQQNGRSHSVRDHWFAKIPMVLGSVTGDEELLDQGLLYIPSFFTLSSSHRIFRRMHRVLNIDKINK